MFKFKSLSQLSIVCLLIIGFSGCMPRGSDEANIYAAPMQRFSRVDYAILKANILDRYCMSCHSEFGSESGVLLHVQPGHPEASELYLRVADGSMPKGQHRLDSSRLQVISTYIEGLANVDPDADIHGITQVDYPTLRSKVLEPFGCVKCHGEFKEEMGVIAQLDPGSPETSNLFKRVADGSMPKNGKPLSAARQELIKTYISGISPAQLIPLEPTWTSLKQNLIFTYCIACHQPGHKFVDEDPTLSFFTEDNVKANFSDILEDMRSGDMPKHKDPVPSNIIDTFEAWTTTGFRH
jgi:hypothetical protein